MQTINYRWIDHKRYIPLMKYFNIKKFQHKLFSNILPVFFPMWNCGILCWHQNSNRGDSHQGWRLGDCRNLVHTHHRNLHRHVPGRLVYMSLYVYLSHMVTYMIRIITQSSQYFTYWDTYNSNCFLGVVDRQPPWVCACPYNHKLEWSLMALV